MARIELESVTKTFGGTQVIHGLDLAIEEGEFCVFVGPSGCGKSTLLRMIAGLEDISGGEIRIDGDRVNEDPAVERQLAMVFQSYALYPHMSVEQNMSFALRRTGTPKAEAREKVRRAAETLQLTEYLDRKPGQLSGGQRQRVAIGRAIVREPRAFLFDEPLSNLDAELRVQMRFEIAKLHQQLSATMIYVTHDQVEAMTLADKIVVLRKGRIEQVGPPARLYGDPDNLFVAGFIGSPQMNFVAVTAEADGLRLPDGSLVASPVPLDRLASGRRYTLGIRPEHLSTEGAGERLSLEVDVSENLGAANIIYGLMSGGTRVLVEDRSGRPISSGERIEVRYERTRSFLFDAEGARIRG
ncbi:hypothetical protein OG2516_16259 [Oceanicola granulosus HTCC2516]|uniref:ABC transporter domain-containing protein n=1 Tax=Oceanicola granulosus (strain ATCC BAA-861 / DSM 15982 / KCTC 12143 / HTCC2516) TaxID=314256 RepID=Q2CGR4_OCEGH|nr:sn-glycerol-3-phosphate ABC transporter ATP-binding protein UgpC [Oceanicola granulosus]EAR51871.1 hypothetical protein OG2516_16259 [Oceanicola granulosus HTCC2516]